jgi:hypothetical protein
VGDVTGSFTNTPFQWVNYFEFGRCFDISNWNTGSASMIAYPCKQDPISAVGWNQTLVWDDVTGQLFTRTSSAGNTYATRCPSTARSTASVPCDQPRLRDHGPVRHGRHPGQPEVGGQPRRRRLLRLVHDGRLRGALPGGRGAQPGVYLAWSSIVSETCDGSGRQKWNAPPNGAPSVTRDTRELTAP